MRTETDHPEVTEPVRYSVRMEDGPVEVVEASRLREVEAEREEAVRNAHKQGEEAEFHRRRASEIERERDEIRSTLLKATAAEHQLHQERERLREAIVQLDRGDLGGGAFTCPQDCAEYLRRTLTDPEDDVGVGAEGPARPSREARGARGNPVIGADSSVGPEPESEPVCETCGGRGWNFGTERDGMLACPDCSSSQDLDAVPEEAPACANCCESKPNVVTLPDWPKGAGACAFCLDCICVILDVRRKELDEALSQRDSRLTKEAVREKLQAEKPTIAFLQAVGRVRPEKNIRALEYAEGIDAALDAAFGDEAR